MTLEAWVDPTSITNTWGDVIYKGYDNYYLGAYSPQSGKPASQGTFGGNDVINYGPTALPANTWTFLAMAYNGSSLPLYVNGTLVSSLAQTW